MHVHTPSTANAFLSQKIEDDLAGLPRDLSTLTEPCKMVFAKVPSHYKCPNYLTFLLTISSAQHVIFRKYTSYW